MWEYWDLYIISEGIETVIQDIPRKRAKKCARKFEFYGCTTRITKGDGHFHKWVERCVERLINNVLNELEVES